VIEAPMSDQLEEVRVRIVAQIFGKGRAAFRGERKEKRPKGGTMRKSCRESDLLRWWLQKGKIFGGGDSRGASCLMKFLSRTLRV